MDDTKKARAYADLMRLVNGYQISQAVHVAASLGVADHLHDTACSIEELASLTASHPGALYRLLRALASVGVLHEGENKTFSLTEMGECLRSDAPMPVGAWAVHIGRPYIWQSWGHLLHSVRTGEVGFEDLYKQSAWDFQAANPEENAIFNRAMTASSQSVVQATLDAYDFGQFRHIADIGGGQGQLLSGILSAYPHVRGTLFDQPHVVTRAKDVLARYGLSERCTIVSGSFFETIPVDADAYLLKSIVHDWDDEKAIAILKVCRRAAGTDAKLLLVERVIEQPNKGALNKFSDLNMLVNLGGRERTPQEYSDLCQSAGFTVRRIIQAGMLYAIVEAEPI
jgi:O-methyltransferase domain/Dimerisation domain